MNKFNDMTLDELRKLYEEAENLHEKYDIYEKRGPGGSTRWQMQGCQERGFMYMRLAMAVPELIKAIEELRGEEGLKCPTCGVAMKKGCIEVSEEGARRRWYCYSCDRVEWKDIEVCLIGAEKDE